MDVANSSILQDHYPIEFKGALKHILPRRNDRRDIFLGDDDHFIGIQLSAAKRLS